MMMMMMMMMMIEDDDMMIMMMMKRGEIGKQRCAALQGRFWKSRGVGVGVSVHGWVWVWVWVGVVVGCGGGVCGWGVGAGGVCGGVGWGWDWDGGGSGSGGGGGFIHASIESDAHMVSRDKLCIPPSSSVQIVPSILLLAAIRRCHSNHMICVLHSFCLLNEMML